MSGPGAPVHALIAVQVRQRVGIYVSFIGPIGTEAADDSLFSKFLKGFVAYGIEDF